MTTSLPPVLALVDRARQVAAEVGRADLAAPLTAAAGRVRRPGTVLCVVGEFKQGKSSLVNALLDEDVCPVDDDLATSVVTIVHHAETKDVVLRRSPEVTDDQQAAVIVEHVDEPDLRTLVTEAGNADNHRRIERVDIGMPNDLLATGLALVDTPGTGGLAAGLAAAALGFLAFADGLLFVTDASQELTRTEVDLLRDATQRCPLVLVVMTKIDLHPHWREIATRNRAHLEAADVHVELLPVSSLLARQGLVEESGLDRLHEAIVEGVVDRAKAVAGHRAADEARSAVQQVLQTVEAELAVLRDPTVAEDLDRQVATSKERLEHLRGPAANWRNVLNDRTNDLVASTNQQLRRMIREIGRGLDERLADLRSNDDWERIARELQRQVGEATAELFASVDRAALTLRRDLVEILAEEDVDLPLVQSGPQVPDVAELWGDRGLGTADRSSVADSIGALRGVQTGMMMFGMMGRVLPAAAGALVASNPILLGAGLLLGGKAVRDQRERRVAQQRQEAKNGIRQFLDDVQFELGPRLQEAVKAVQRDLRDGVQEQIAQLQATWTETGRQAQAALAATAAERSQRLAELEPLQAELSALHTTAEQLASIDVSP